MAFMMSTRPRNWYDLSYEQQREWERNERRHQDEVYDIERREREAREDAEAQHARLMRARREWASVCEEYADEISALRSDLDNIAAERDALIDQVRRFRIALAIAGRIENHSTDYVASKVLVPLGDDERAFWASRRINRRLADGR